MRFRVTALDHVNVTTPKELEDDMTTWYTGVLGLERIAKPPGTRARGAWFRAGPAQVHVSVDPHNPPKTAHYALRVDAFPTAVERLRRAGCHIEQAAEIPGWSRCFVRDPAGNRIEILARDEEPATASLEEPA